jgi:hypothetical protein
MIALYLRFTFSLSNYSPTIPSCFQGSRKPLAYSAQLIWKLPGMVDAAEVAEVAVGVGGTMGVHQIVEGEIHFIHAQQVMAQTPRVLMETTEMVATTGTMGVEATLIHNLHILREPLTLHRSNNMEVMVGMAVALLEDVRHRIMVVIALAVVVRFPEVVLPIMFLRMANKVAMVAMEQLITQVDIVAAMVDMVLVMGTGIKMEAEEVHHTTTPRLEEEAGLGSEICTVNFL